ncbi:MAG: VOC family protein [Prevotellaceae bacterium]|nr:VOC family protein [Prevotellaceae bacterium]
MKDLFLGTDHPAIAAENSETLSNWYCEVLGYKIYVQTKESVYLLEAPDKTFLEIMPKDETPRQERTVKTPGFSHLALRISDMDMAMAELDKFCVKWNGAEFEAVGGARIRNFFDPEGNVLQIVQR